MHKYYLMILLAITSSDVLAEWKEVGIDPDSQITTYADPSSIQKTGNIVQMWHLFDFKTTTDGLRSLKVNSEYNCKSKQSRSLYTSAHKGNMGTGELKSSKSFYGEWQTITLGTPKEYLFYIACAK